MRETTLPYSVILMFVGTFCTHLINNIKILPVIVWGVFAILNLRIWKLFSQREYSRINLYVFLLCLGAVISWYSARTIIWEYIEVAGSETKLVRVLFRCFGLLTSLLFVENVIKYGKSLKFLSLLYKCFIFYILIIDVEAVLFISHTEIVKDDTTVEYLGGNKFTLTYANMYLAIIYYKYKKLINAFNGKTFCLLLILSLFISAYVQCSTSVLACLVMMFFFFYRIYKRSTLYKSWFYIAVASACTSAFWAFSAVILNMGFVRKVLNFLRETDDLSGRLILYVNLRRAIEDRPLFGYGLGNSGAVVNNVSNSFNAQNGVLDLYLQLGVYGVLFYFLILIYFLKETKIHSSSHSILCFLYVILIISMVEIPLSFSTLFIASLALIAPQKIISYEKAANH